MFLHQKKQKKMLTQCMQRLFITALSGCAMLGTPEVLAMAACVTSTVKGGFSRPSAGALSPFCKKSFESRGSALSKGQNDPTLSGFCNASDPFGEYADIETALENQIAKREAYLNEVELLKGNLKSTQELLGTGRVKELFQEYPSLEIYSHEFGLRSLVGHAQSDLRIIVKLLDGIREEYSYRKKCLLFLQRMCKNGSAYEIAHKNNFWQGYIEPHLAPGYHAVTGGTLYLSVQELQGILINPEWILFDAGLSCDEAQENKVGLMHRPESIGYQRPW